MLILNSRTPSQKFYAAEGPSAEQAKTYERTEGKVDSATPDTNKPDDYTKQTNRQDLYQRAQKAVEDLRSHGKEKEASSLEYSLKVAQGKEGLTIENSEAVKANYANRVNRLLRDATSPLVGPSNPNGPMVFKAETITGTPPAKDAAALGITYTPEGRPVVVGGGKRATAGAAPIVEGPTPTPKDPV